MRKLTALILILLLCGCAATAVVSVPEPPVQEELPPVEVLPSQEVISYTVGMSVWTDEALTEDSTQLATYTFVLPELRAVREDGTVIVEPQNDAEEQALSAIAAFNEKFGKWARAEEFHEIVSWAEEQYASMTAEGIEWFAPYALELDCTVYQTDHIISVSGIYYSYTGGAHPNTWRLGWNYDLETGEFMDLEMLGEGTELNEAVAAEIIRQAQIPLEDGLVRVEMYWEDYEEIVANWSSYAVTFGETGMELELMVLSWMIFRRI